MSKFHVHVATSPMQGQGVFADRGFKTGELVLEIDDTHVVTDETQLTQEQHDFDLDYIGDKQILMQSPEKYINHSCEPNTFVKTKNGVRQVLAMRDISRGEEITYDYAVNGDNDGTFSCHCGSEKCRKTYQGNFFKLQKEIQIQYLPYLDNWFVEKYQDEIRAIS